MSKVNAIRSIKKSKNTSDISPNKLTNDNKNLLKDNSFNKNTDNSIYLKIHQNKDKKNSAQSKPKSNVIPIKINDVNDLEVRRVQSSNYKRKIYQYPDHEKLSFIDEEFNQLKVLWSNLGVTDEYRNYFEIYAKEFQAKDQKDYFIFEINNLKKIQENLSVKKLTKEINTREKTIFLIRQFDEYLNNTEINPNIINDILQTFRNLRVLSINIVNLYVKCRELISYHLYSGKFDIEKINVNYIFDRGYLLKMKSDTDFLRQTSLIRYFNFSDESDPFLLALSESKKENEVNPNGEETSIKKIILPVNPDLLASIKNWYKKI